MAERDLLVRFIGDDKDLQRAVRRSEKGVAGLDAKLSRSAGGLAKWGKAAALAGAGAAAGVGLLVAKSVGAASDLNEEISKSNVLFGASAAGIQKWSKTTASSIGLSRREALGAAGSFAAMFSTIGVGDSTSADMSKRLVTLGADLASFSNQDPAEMLDKLRSGLAGEAEPLRRFGILLSEQRVKQEAVRMGIAKTGDELTEQQKVQARYSLILRDAGKANGDFARTSDSLANAQRIARAQIEDLSASIGGALLPVVARGLTAFNNFLPTITTGVQGLSARVGPTLARLFDGFEKKIPQLKTLFFSVVGPIQTEVVPILRELAGVVAQTWSNVVAILAQNAGSIRKILSNVGQTLRMVWTVAKPTIVFLFTKVLPTAMGISIRVLEKVSGVAKTLAQVFVRVVRVIVGALDKLLGAASFVGDALNTILPGDPFKGTTNSINRARKRLRDFGTDLDALDGKQITVGVNIQTKVAPGMAHGGGKSATEAAADSATRSVQDSTAATESLGGALDTKTKVTKNVETKAEKARKAFDALMDRLSLRFDMAEAKKAFSSELAILRAEEQAVKDQIAVEGRTTELLRTLWGIRQQQAQIRTDQRKGRQFVALGLTAEGEKRTPSARALLKRVGSLSQRIKGTPLDTAKTRTELARITKVLRGAYGKAGKDIRDAILAMLDEIGSALSGKTSKTGGSSGTGEITRGGIRSGRELTKGLGLTPAQEAAIRRRNMRVTRRNGRVSAFGYVIGRGTADPQRDRGWEGTRGASPARDAYVFNGPITVVANDPESFMRALQKKSARTASSRRGRHGGVRLGLG